MKLDEIEELGEKILNHWALTDTKQLGLRACGIAAQLYSENEALKVENARVSKRADDLLTAFKIIGLGWACDACIHRNALATCPDDCMELSGFVPNLKTESAKEV